MKKGFVIWFYSCIFFVAGISAVHAMTFAVISDTWADTLDNALEFIVSQDAAFILLPGDFYYDAQDYYSHFVKFGFAVGPENPPDRQPVYFAIGNHDDSPFGDDNFVTSIAPYYPKNGPALAPQGTVFSFDRGACHFVITNPYWKYAKGGGYNAKQLDWLEQDLAASNQPFKFVLGHEPAFPIERHVGNSLDVDPEMRNTFWRILSENHVTAFLCGHTHHLSLITKNGVWQVDAGEVQRDDLCVTLVTVDGETAVLRSYKTSGAIPVSEQENPDANDLIFESVLTPSTHAVPETDIQYLYGAAPAVGGDENASGLCFINTLK